MNISTRLKAIASLVDECDKIADIGTDHGYLPIFLMKNHVCEKAIASDINKGPVERAKENIIKEGLENNISCRLGPGMNTIKPHEVDCAIIAGMGGNLIRDIIEQDKEVFKSLKYLILQPVQNPDVLRKYIYDSGYEILEEELCVDENKYYEIIKVKYDEKPHKPDPIYYEVSSKLIEKKHPLIKEYIDFKIHKYNNVLSYISEDTALAEERKIQLNHKINKLEEKLKCL